MIPTLFTGGVLIAPGAGLISSGYVAGNTLAAQHLNYYFNHLTAELNNLIAAAGIGQSTADDFQVMKAVRAPVQVAVSAGGTTTISALAFPTQIVCTNGSAATVDISAGATVAGTVLTISVKSGVGVTIQTGTGMTAFLGDGSVRLTWDGTQWSKIGGAILSAIFTSGTGATWKTPWAGLFKCTVVGGGGGSSGCKSNATTDAGVGGGGGGGGGTSIAWLAELSGVTLTYTVGAAGAAGAATPTAGGNGGNSTLADGTRTLTGNGGVGAALSQVSSAGAAFATDPGAGGTASGGDLNVAGTSGGRGFACSVVSAANVFQRVSAGGGAGGSSYLGGGGAPGTLVNGGPGSSSGVAGAGYGAGAGGGASVDQATGNAGAAGTAGVIVVEF